MNSEKAALPGAALSESQAAAKPQVLDAQNNAPLTLAALGAMLRDEKLRAAYDSADKWQRWTWQTIIAFLAVSGQPFTADTCRDLGAPETSHPNHIGAFFMASFRAGVIRPVGFAQSTRQTRHSAWMRQWVGGDAR